MADVELTGAQARELQSMDTAIAELQSILTRAERAGLDVRDWQDKLNQANAKRQGLLQQFAPGTGQRRQR